MSIAKMKLAAIVEICKINDEEKLKEILDHIATISGNTTSSFDLDAFLKKAGDKYNEILKKMTESI